MTSAPLIRQSVSGVPEEEVRCDKHESTSGERWP